MNDAVTIKGRASGPVQRVHGGGGPLPHQGGAGGGLQRQVVYSTFTCRIQDDVVSSLVLYVTYMVLALSVVYKS